MPVNVKFRVQSGALVLEMEGPRAFVEGQIQRQRKEIEELISEQVRLIKSGKAPAAPAVAAATGKLRGRPPKGTAAKATPGRKPGRHTVIIRDSKLSLKDAQLKGLREFITGISRGAKLGKDASVFAIAYYLCANILGGDRFTAGDVSVVYKQLGTHPSTPAANSVDVVQMLRNLAATSIGKVWVVRNPDGSFSLTPKGKDIGKSGKVVRPRGRRPGAGAPAPKKAGKRRGRKPGRPSKVVAAAAPKRRGRPPKNAVAAVAAAPKRRGRPPKNAVAAVAAVVAPKRRGRPPKNSAVAAAPKRRPGRPRMNPVSPDAPRRKPGRPPKAVVAAAAPKRRGRPPKSAMNLSMLAASATPVKRRPGRPRKIKA